MQNFESFENSHRELRLQLQIDFQKLAEEILRVMRGEVSQRKLSEQMGFSFNQVGKWESGATRIKWDDFLRLGSALEVPIEKYFRFSFWTHEPQFDVLSSLRALENNLGVSLNADAQSKSNLKKWLSGVLVPDLADVLKMMGLKSPVLLGWLSLFIDCRKLPSIKEIFESFVVTMDSVLTDPLVLYVNAALHLKSYRDLLVHDEPLLAEHSTCSIDQLRSTLQTLSEFGLVHFDGKKYYPSAFDFSFAGLRHPKLRGVTRYTTNLAAQRYSLTPARLDNSSVRTPSLASVRVVALSADAAKKVVDLVSKFHNEVGEIVAHDELPKDNVQVILVHSFASNINAPKNLDEPTVTNHLATGISSDI